MKPLESGEQQSAWQDQPDFWLLLGDYTAREEGPRVARGKRAIVIIWKEVKLKLMRILRYDGVKQK